MTAPALPDLPIAIVGAGFSGTLLAINLVRYGARVVLVERSGAHLARGVAFGTRRPEHLLNVRAANMSAFPDDPGHFLRWMGFDAPEQSNRFVPRLAYGHYLREQLLGALSAAPDRLVLHEGEAQDLTMASDRVALVTADGDTIEAGALVLALGNLPPAPHGDFAGLSPELFRPDPWAGGACEGLDGVSEILLIGTGLTAIDIVTSLVGNGYKGRITAMSRRGLVPRAHAEVGPKVGEIRRPEARGSWLVRQLRERSAEVGWRAAVDELRPHLQDLWRSHDAAAQSRFLRHLRPWWDVHRHRLAPQVAERIAALEAEGRLRFVAGRITGVEEVDSLARVTWRPRGEDAEHSAGFERIIACTGPEADITRVADPFLRTLLDQGLIRPDRHFLGVDVDRAGRAIGTDGRAENAIYAVGPLTRGEAWEITAVPDIRRQVWDLARVLTNNHWVAAEGL